VSPCLLGERVRYDGAHKRDEVLLGAIGGCVEWVPVCPEVEVGMGTPREPVRLEGAPDAPRMVGAESGRDWTNAMREWAETRLDQLAALGLHGYVLMENSPSCGLHGVRVRGSDGASRPNGRGLFADALSRRFPLLPVEESGRLHDPDILAAFLGRVRTYARTSIG